MPKLLHVVDARTGPASPTGEADGLASLAAAAVAAGGGRVLETSHVQFPNGAVTLVLILAESHLSIHTWPEADLIAIDLFSCGAIDGDRVIAELVAALRLNTVTTRTVPRGDLAGRAPA